MLLTSSVVGGPILKILAKHFLFPFDFNGNRSRINRRNLADILIAA
jgi:hypothetical protein